jgi:GrpB-like predicted nucleotidyltransferase (UPF0157 family)
MKRVNELSKQEIAKMFPVELSKYDSSWSIIFNQERELIKVTLGEIALRIEHFGSTSIPNILAKDTIDILVEIPSDVTTHGLIIEKMKHISYDFFLQEDGDPPYMVFVKGYNTTGVKEQTYHIHMGSSDHKLWDRLYFRDYLRENIEVAKQYESLKLTLSGTHKFDRVGYRIAKTDFVIEITEMAKKYYLQAK